jgi:hypothetical protein
MKIKSRRMRCAMHVAQTGENKYAYSLWGWGDLKERKYKEDLGIDGTIILKWVLKK